MRRRLLWIEEHTSAQGLSATCPDQIEAMAHRLSHTQLCAARCRRCGSLPGKRRMRHRLGGFWPWPRSMMGRRAQRQSGSVSCWRKPMISVCRSARGRKKPAIAPQISLRTSANIAKQCPLSPFGKSDSIGARNNGPSVWEFSVHALQKFEEISISGEHDSGSLANHVFVCLHRPSEFKEFNRL